MTTRNLLSFYLIFQIFLSLSFAKEPKFHKIFVGEKPLLVEVANTIELRKQGLKQRPSLPEGKGMLFIFEHPQKLSFWMKDTQIPLSIAFISKSGIIREIHPLTPLSLEPVRSLGKCLFALEVNQDWFRENEITPGMRVDIAPSIIQLNAVGGKTQKAHN